jgi:amidase
MSTSQESDSRGQVSRRDFLALLAGGIVASFHNACSPQLTISPAGKADRGSLHYASLTEVARLIKSREISSVELTQMMLDRIDTIDVRLHSYATVMASHALAAAHAAEREIQSGSYWGPLHGVPIAVKDLCYTKGVPTMGGLKVLADFIPDHDATVVSKLEAAGAVLLGKLNLTEGAMGGYHPEFDAPVNPWAEDRWTGVSSSGSGVATAAGLCFASLGSDTGGSIRFPAASCGIVGLKPTWGRVSRYGVLALAESLDHVGPLTRRVADAAIMLEAIAGYDANDPTSLRDPVPPMVDGIDAGIRGLRVGLDKSFVTKGVDPEVSAGVLESVTVLRDLGARVVAVKMPKVDAIPVSWMTLCASEAVAAHERYYPDRADEYGPWFRDFLDLGASVSGADYARANNARAAFNGALKGVLEEVDIIICPTMPTPPEPITREELYGPMILPDDDRLTPIQFTAPFDFSGSPTISLPSGFSKDGIPLSVQFVGHHLQEAILCRVGHAYESATEWHLKHPKL